MVYCGDILVLEIENLKRIRKKLNLTQKQFANAAHVSQSMIAKIESGTLDPTYSKIKHIEQAIKELSKEKEMTAKGIMTRNIISVKATEKANDVIRLMTKKSISQVPVMKEGKIIGMVSERTIIEKMAKKDISALRAKDIMDETPPMISENTPLSVMNSLITHYPMLIVTEKGELKGIVTKSDLIKSMI